jgi:glucose-6-phosphate isomerase
MSIKITTKTKHSNANFTLEDISNINEFAYLKQNTYLEKIDEYNRFLEPIINKYSHFVILGAGGSVFHINAIVKSLTLEDEKIDIIYNANEKHFQNILKKITEKTFFILVTKAGRSEEVNIFAEEIFEKLDKSLNNCLIISTEKGLNNINLKHPNCYKIQHEDVSGRFSCFSTPFMLPILLFKKFDIKEFFKGAEEVVINPNIKSIHSFISAYKNGANVSVLISHIENMTYFFFLWYEQILMESCGKNKAGMDALFSNGITDMHSKYQMFLEGRPNKIFTVFSAKNQPHLLLLKDLIQKKKDISIELIEKTEQPIRVFEMDYFNEYNLGKIMSQLCQEVIQLAYFMKINPFNQPAVEELKIVL